VNRPRISLVLVTLAALGSLVALVGTRPALNSAVLGRGDDLALVVAWSVAVAASAWLFLSTAACVVALGVGRPHFARRLAPALPFGIRRLVEVAVVAATFSLGAVPAFALGPAGGPARGPAIDQPVVRASATAGRAAPASPVTPVPRARPRRPATTTAPAPPPIRATRSAPASSIPRTATPGTATPFAPARSSSPAESAPVGDGSAGRSAGPGEAGRHVVVHPGDNLWLIARAALTPATGRPPDERAVARYWLAVIDANRATLRSGNPNLIFPGEIVTLPARPTVP